MAREQILLDIPAEYENNIFGGLDVHLKKIERNLDVDVIVRDGSVKVEGESGNVAEAKRVFTELLELAKRGNTITEQNVNYLLALSKEKSPVSLAEIDNDLIAFTIQGKPVKPKTLGQKKICGCYPRENDGIWCRTGGNRKNLSGDGNGDTGI